MRKNGEIMRKISIFALIASLFASSVVMANEVNVFNARHYKADGELYSKFTNMTGIKVNLINGKSGALEKRIQVRVLILLLTYILQLMLEDVERWMQKGHFKVV